MSRKRTIWKCDWCGEWGNGLSLAASSADYLMHRGTCGLNPDARIYVRTRMDPAWWEQIRRTLPARQNEKLQDIFDWQNSALPGGEE